MPCERDLVIIGGGPAGLAAAIYAGRGDLKTTVLERLMVGGQVALTTDIANYPGFPESVTGPDLAAKMRAQAERFGVEFLNAEATDLTRDNEAFTVHTQEETFCAKTVVLAAGSDPRKLGVPGEDAFRGSGVSYCGTCDAPFFRDKKVLAVGGGDAALKESLHLAKFASDVVLIHRRDAFRAEKIYQKQVVSHEHIDVRWFTELREIRGDNKVASVTLEQNQTGERSELAVDGVFIFVGTIPNTGLLSTLLPEAAGGHVKTDLDMMTEIPGLFAVGDVREHSYRQVATGVGEGATAAIAVEHYLAHHETL